MSRFAMPLLVAGCAVLAPPLTTGQTTAGPKEEPTELPEGLSAADWSGILAAYESGRAGIVPIERGSGERAGGQLGLTAFTGRTEHTWEAPPTISQQAYIKASNTGTGDRFGYALGISGNTVVVGAYREDSNATGVGGDQSNNSSQNSGAVYVFVRDGTIWTQQAYLKASNNGAGDEFGRSVAVSGDTLVVGAFREDSSATGVDGNGNNNGAPNSGAAYVFVRNGTTWSQQAYLKASNTDANDGLGHKVAMSGDTVVLCAWYEDGAATGVNGDGTDNSAPDAGAAYVFARTGTTWSQQAYLKASNTDAGDEFSFPVAISGDTIVLGARMEDSSASGVNGSQGNGLSNSGAAYVFVRNGSTWTQEAYLKASNPDVEDRFGHEVAIAGDTALIGAYLEDGGTTGVNGDQSDNSAPDSGAAYVFQRSGSGWSQEAYLKASNTDAKDRFSLRLAVGDDLIAVGAYQEKSRAEGINGDQLDNTKDEAGSAYVFLRDRGVWTQLAYLKGSTTDAGDNFGRPVRISGKTVAIAAWPEDSNATGINGDQGNNNAFASGAVYVFVMKPTLPLALEIERPGTPPMPSALRAGLTSGPVLGSTWDPVIDHSEFMPAARLDLLSILAEPLDFRAGPRGAALEMTPVSTFLSTPGEPFAIAIPHDPVLAGTKLLAQGAAWDGTDLRLTNALEITLGTR